MQYRYRRAITRLRCIMVGHRNPRDRYVLGTFFVDECGRCHKRWLA